MKKITVGLICTPNLPAEIAGDLIKELSDMLFDKVDDNVVWETDMTVDPIVGVAEDTDEVLQKAIKIKQENQWDYTICLTDLPTFYGKYIVIADANVEEGVGQVSVPTFGFIPVHKRIRKTLMHLMEELHVKHLQHDHTSGSVSETKESSRKKSSPNKLTKQFSLSAIGEMHEKSGDSGVDLRYFIRSRIVGFIRVLLGMTYANKPWETLLSFNKVVAVSFATGSYISIFSTPWELSIAYSPWRLLFLMFVSIFGMVIWVIFSQNLWEKPSTADRKRWRQLYNATTFVTLSMIVIMNYALLFILFLIAISLFVPPYLFEAWTGLDKGPSFIYYIRLVWLITSLGTLAGAIGSGLENEQKVRDATYSYRQKQRYYEINREKSKETSEDTNTESI